MSIEERANVILKKVFSHHDFEKYRLVRADEHSEYIVIPGNGSPRWLVPRSALYGLSVLTDWSPYGFSSKIKWFLLKVLYRFNLLTQAPGITTLIIDKFQNNTKKNSEKNKASLTSIPVIPVIYVGTPGPQQKAVITLVEEESKQPVCVIKIALEQRAKVSILQEADILVILNKSGITNVPELIKSNDLLGFSQQTILKGSLSSRRFTKSHLKFLLSLPMLSEKTCFMEQKKKVLALYDGQQSNFFPLQLKLIEEAINLITSHNTIALAFNHGDFTPWNIKQTRDEECKVFDWEDAQVEGLPFWDICHFFLMQAHLFKEKKQINELITAITKDNNSIINSYLNEMNINVSDAKQLVLLYFLFTIFNVNTSTEYKTFLIGQLSLILNIELVSEK
jgi:hypothetical protein